MKWTEKKNKPQHKHNLFNIDDDNEFSLGKKQQQQHTFALKQSQ